MGMIYHSASSVIAWLGKEREEEDVKFSTSRVSECHKEKLCEWQWLEKMPQLVNRSYWTRMWVIQEFRNATHLVILCGERWIDERDFFDLYSTWAKSAKSEGQEVDCPARPFMLEHRLYSDRSVMETLLSFRHGACKDPKDKILALLGLFPTH